MIETNEKEHKTPIKCYLLLGRSASGKSTIAFDMVKDEKRVYVVNVEDEAPYKREKYKIIDWSQLPEVRAGSIIVEDILKLTEPQRQILHKLLSYNAHHYPEINTIILISHSITKTGLYGFLSFLTHVIFTCCKSNIGNLHYVLNFYKFNKQERQAFSDKFIESVEQFNPFTLHVEDRKMCVSKPVTTQSVQVLKPNQVTPGSNVDPAAKVRYYLKLLRSPHLACAIYDLIQQSKEIKLSADGMQIRARGKKTFRRFKFNLVDYIGTLVTPGEKMDRGMKKLHLYIMRKISVPRMFLLNKRVRKIR